MDLVFIRHGHGEHLNDYPNQLNMLHPGLTEYGRWQVDQLRSKLPIHSDDIIIVSPTKRTIETAALLAPSQRFYISPMVGPRMFRQDPDTMPFGCDQIYTREEVARLYPGFALLDFELDCWVEGINAIDQELFESYARQLLGWCAVLARRVIVISHDGTITNYRIMLGETGLTRKDFLGEAGIYVGKYDG